MRTAIEMLLEIQKRESEKQKKKTSAIYKHIKAKCKNCFHYVVMTEISTNVYKISYKWGSTEIAPYGNT